MKGRRMLGIVVAVALLGVGCASMQDDKMAAKKSLYDRLGGEPAIAAVKGAHRRHGGGGSLYLILRR